MSHPAGHPKRDVRPIRPIPAPRWHPNDARLVTISSKNGQFHDLYGYLMVLPSRGPALARGLGTQEASRPSLLSNSPK